jgi:type II secretory ATPase GspE/PulE/Tfp pilus assembly ATPase PilB-like protein
LRFRHGCETEVVVVTDLAIEAAFDRCWGGQIDRLLASIDPPDTSSVAPPIDAARPSAPIIRLVDHLIDEAVAQGASDIHLGPVAGELRVRMRIDGVLRERHRVGEGAGRAVVSRIKIMAGMDIAIQRRPQDGGLNRNTAEGPLALRVSCLPCEGGEKVVIRILDPRRSPGGLTALGLASDDHRRILGLLERAQGVVLVAGPTGSGKSSTLQAALRELDRSTLNVVTLEDPVEHRVPGVTHVQVHPRSGLTFPTGLRAVLRQDPDVLMIGEIRDRETAEIAMNAAITGHLVLSTIHTTDAPGAIARLRHMGVPAHLVAGGLSGVIAQRLVRRTCTRCSGRLDRECPACIDGLRGRTGIFQVLGIDDRQREAIAGRVAAPRSAGGCGHPCRRRAARGRTGPHHPA